MMQRNAIEQLFRQHYSVLFELACRMVHDNDAARDIVHDVFTSLLSEKPLNIISGAYLVKAVKNRCLNHIRMLSTRDRIKNLYALELDDVSEEEDTDNETIERIRHIVDNVLPEQCRNVVRLRFTENMSYREISDYLRISEVMVYKHLHRALNVLRENLNKK